MGRLYDGAVVRHLISIVVVVVLVAHPMVHVQRSRDSLTFCEFLAIMCLGVRHPPPHTQLRHSDPFTKKIHCYREKMGGGGSRTLF